MRLGAICLNWKIVAGLAAVAAGIWVVAPQVFLSALPVLALLACPLSMLIMMRGMGAKGNMGSMNGMGSSTQSPARDMSPDVTPPRQDQALAPGETRAARLAELHARLERARRARGAGMRVRPASWN